MRFKNAYAALWAARKKYPYIRLPLRLIWQALNGLYYWTRFARNGRIIATSSEGFFLEDGAIMNYWQLVRDQPEYLVNLK